VRPFLALSAATVAILVAGPLQAETDGSVMAIDATQPAEGQVDVPVDAHLRVLVRRADYGSEDYADTKLRLTRDGATVEAHQLELSGNRHVFVLVPNAPLTAGTTFVLEIQGVDVNYGGGALTKVSFTTSSSTTPPLTDAPALEILSAEYEADADGDGDVVHHIDFRITPAVADPSGLSLLRLVKDDISYQSFAIGPAEPIEGTTGYLGTEDEEICMRAAHQSANGSLQLSAPVCITSQAGGCSTARTSTSAGIWSFAPLALALLAMRRRRTGI
jgi:MYXO-CTERM domain-containing protein